MSISARPASSSPPRVRRLGAPSRSAGRRPSAGQSIVEFALVLPLMIILALAVIDFARIYTTLVSVESAAREAADFGTFGSQKWNDAVYSFPGSGTLDQMRHRACVAASDLPDYVGPDDACTNPGFTYELSGDKGATWQAGPAGLDCDNETRAPPCWLRVTLTYDFKVITPLSIELGGVKLGLPSVLTFQRSSVFAMTDLSLP
jgi:TadE-like protein